MENSPHYRHELKYEITRREYEILRSRLQAVMQPDPNAGPDGTYQIRSLYFDNYEDSALWEKISGVENRNKYRIRYYGTDTSFVILEKKSKRSSLCLKQSCRLPEEALQAILRGRPEEIRPEEQQGVLAELCRDWRERQMRPRTIVDYRRCAFIYEPGNVRVTFDMEIRSGLYSTDLFDRTLPMMPVFPGRMILEVKYDAFLPDLIRMAVSCSSVRIGAFSKYAACRKYE